MTDTKIQKIVMTALFAALTCVATMVIRIPVPGTSGYVHPGDAIVILSGILLGPTAGFFAAGIGSSLSDLIGGYFMYVPVTFLVKGLIALAGGQLYKKFKASPKEKYIGIVLCGILDIVFVVLGYGIFETFVFQLPAALAAAAPNAVQGAVGLVLALLLYKPLSIAIKWQTP